MSKQTLFPMSTCVLCFLLGFAAGIAVFIKLAGSQVPAHLDTIEQVR